MQLSQEVLENIRDAKSSNLRFWPRFPDGMPDFKGKRVLDLGCGYGCLTIDIANAGAKEVVGLDINKKYIGIANAYRNKFYPSFSKVIRFSQLPLEQCQSSYFDYIISKDTFEHVENFELILKNIYHCLKPGGKLYAGFGPLWNSPYGGHRHVSSTIPWLHKIMTKERVMNQISKKIGRRVYSLSDIGLNQISFNDYWKIFRKSKFSILYFRVNASDKLISRMFSSIRKIPLLREYFSFNIYCILQK